MKTSLLFGNKIDPSLFENNSDIVDMCVSGGKGGNWIFELRTFLTFKYCIKRCFTLFVAGFPGFNESWVTLTKHNPTEFAAFNRLGLFALLT